MLWKQRSSFVTWSKWRLKWQIKLHTCRYVRCVKSRPEIKNLEISTWSMRCASDTCRWIHPRWDLFWCFFSALLYLLLHCYGAFDISSHTALAALHTVSLKTNIELFKHHVLYLLFFIRRMDFRYSNCLHEHPFPLVDQSGISVLTLRKPAQRCSTIFKLCSSWHNSGAFSSISRLDLFAFLFLFCGFARHVVVWAIPSYQNLDVCNDFFINLRKNFWNCIITTAIALGGHLPKVMARTHVIDKNVL